MVAGPRPSATPPVGDPGGPDTIEGGPVAARTRRAWRGGGQERRRGSAVRAKGDGARVLRANEPREAPLRNGGREGSIGRPLSSLPDPPKGQSLGTSATLTIILWMAIHVKWS